MKLADVIAHFDTLAPPHTAEPWDNVGLLVGDRNANVRKAMLCIDYTAAVADEAKAAGIDFVIAYHPPIFKALKQVTADGPSALVFDAVRRGIAIYSPHTALDVAEGGTNDVLADVLGLVDRRPLKALDATTNDPRLTTLVPAPTGAGIGRVGRLQTPTPRAILFDRIKAGLGVDHLLIAGPTEGDVQTAAVCAGSCGEYLGQVLAARPDLYLTGEMRHHDALAAAAVGITVVCALHSNSERITLRKLAERLTKEVPNIAWQVSAADRDPFSIR